MSLGDAFPKAMIEASSARQLKAGAVLKLRAVLDDEQEREKRFVVVSVTADVFVCVMNSVIHPLIAKNADLLKCQVAAYSERHEFADKDCHFDCSKAFTFKKSEVLEQLTSKPTWVLGFIDEDLRDEIRSALQASPLIPPIQCSSFCESLDSIEFD